MDLDSAAEELYGVPAEEFTSSRDRLAAQAKADGDKALAASIGKLRKPVQAAALINELVRAEPAELTELTDLGEQMRDAHRQLRGPELRALSEQRQQLLHRLTDLVRETAGQDGRSVTDAVLDQVRGTFEAAIADQGAEAAVLSGRLTTVLSYTGFGEVDVTDAVAAPVRKRHLKSVPAGTDAKPSGTKERSAAADTEAGPTKPGSKRADRDTGSSTKPSSSAEQASERRRQRHAEQLKRAEAEHAEAVRALDWAQEEAERTEQLHKEATDKVEQLRAQLEQAQEQAWRAGQASRAAERNRQTAQQEADRTASALQAARDQLAD